MSSDHPAPNLAQDKQPVFMKVQEVETENEEPAPKMTSFTPKWGLFTPPRNIIQVLPFDAGRDCLEENDANSTGIKERVEDVKMADVEEKEDEEAYATRWLPRTERYAPNWGMSAASRNIVNVLDRKPEEEDNESSA